MRPSWDRFVSEYMVDLNAGQAAIRSGYSPRSAYTTGTRLLRNDEIRKAINGRIEERRQRVNVDADTVLRELYSVAMSDIGALFDNAGRLKPLADMEPEARRAIAGIETSEAMSVDGAKPTSIQVRKIRLWSKLAALDKLARHLGLLTEKVELTVKNGGPVEYGPIERASRIAAILETAKQRKGKRPETPWTP